MYVVNNSMIPWRFHLLADAPYNILPGPSLSSIITGKSDLKDFELKRKWVLEFPFSLHVCGVWVSLQASIIEQGVELYDSYTKAQKTAKLLFSV